MAKKNIGFENIAELFPTELTVINKDTGAEKTVKTVDRAEICTIVAYMLGIEDNRLEQYYGPKHSGDLAQIRKSRQATVIRYLNRVRSKLMFHYKKIDQKLCYELVNLDGMEFFRKDEILALEDWGIRLLQANYRAEMYAVRVNKLIEMNIDSCACLFPEYVNFKYIRDLFVIPKYEKSTVLKSEWSKYVNNYSLYPFQAYMHWKPAEKGYILQNDGRFLGEIYRQHDDFFYDKSLYRDAVDATKQDIYQFIDASKSAIMVVDCENSDPYKLYGVLKNLNSSEVEQIKKIILFDDSHTTSAWDYLEKLIAIPVEHKEVKRILGHKSLVDINLAVGVSREFYENHIDSCILCSSDSDFWGLISALDKVRYLVMYEYGKCSPVTKEALAERGIFHCSIDDFYRGNATDLQKIVLQKTLEKHLSEIIGINGWELVKQVYEEAYISATTSEMKAFYDKYIKTLRLKLGDDGQFYIAVA